MMPTLGILVKMTFGPDKQGWQGGRKEAGPVLGSTQYGWDLSLCCVPRPFTCRRAWSDAKQATEKRKTINFCCLLCSALTECVGEVYVGVCMGVHGVCVGVYVGVCVWGICLCVCVCE